jgi:hypothetical protein
VNRDELEAAIWRQVRFLNCQSPRARQAAMNKVLSAADAYAAYTGGITAQRRAELGVPAPAALSTVHFQVPCPIHDDGSCTQARSCNRNCWTAAVLITTTVTADVTCRRCQWSVRYREALGRKKKTA